MLLLFVVRKFPIFFGLVFVSCSVACYGSPISLNRFCRLRIADTILRLASFLSILGLPAIRCLFPLEILRSRRLIIKQAPQGAFSTLFAVGEANARVLCSVSGMRAPYKLF